MKRLEFNEVMKAIVINNLLSIFDARYGIIETVYFLSIITITIDNMKKKDYRRWLVQND